MNRYYIENKQLYLVLGSWLLVGSFNTVAAYALIPLSLILLYKKGFLEELLIGYLFILILSDSLDMRFEFAKNAKNEYITLLSLFFFLDIKKFQPLNKLYMIFLPFFAFSIFTMMFSVIDPFFFTSLQKTLSYALIFIVIPNYITRIYREQGVDFFKRMLFFILTMLLLGFFLKYTIPSIATISTGRYRGVMGNPNGIGIFCLLAYILFFIATNYYPEMLKKREKTMFIAAILLSIYFSASRNSMIALLIFYMFQRFFSYSPALGFIIFILVVVVFEVVSANITSIVLALGLGDILRVRTLEDGSGRYIAWAFAWQQIQKNFFVGKGFAYNEFYMRQHYKELTKMGHQGGIHNSFLTFWMDQGLIGLLIYLRSYILMFILASKKTKYAFPVMFAFIFTAMFESWLVGSLSAYAFLAVFVYTLITSDEIVLFNLKERLMNAPVEKLT